MKLFVFILALSFNASIGQAAVIDVSGGELYRGEELVNERPTGGICYLYIDYVETIPKGLYCHSLTTRPVFFTDRDSHPKDEIKVMGNITNYHRPEYPALKTCAMSLDGKTSGNDIYESDDTNLYNQLFSWADKHGGYQFDFFVTFSPTTKRPSRTRLHRMNWMSEKNYDCVNLQKL
ncbi:MAG: hypothetical protein J0L82_19045 [Deltaproteobacteria bacterium]|nr:hypothetical protein [Deltaproteobacteria bacterium]